MYARVPTLPLNPCITLATKSCLNNPYFLVCGMHTVTTQAVSLQTQCLGGVKGGKGVSCRLKVGMRASFKALGLQEVAGTLF